jgi:hypothetical protein
MRTNTSAVDTLPGARSWWQGAVTRRSAEANGDNRRPALATANPAPALPAIRLISEASFNRPLMYRDLVGGGAHDDLRGLKSTLRSVRGRRLHTPLTAGSTAEPGGR